MIEGEYQPRPKLMELALDLEELNRRFRNAGISPAETRAYLKGFADAKLNRGPKPFEVPDAGDLPQGVSEKTTKNGPRYIATLRYVRDDSRVAQKRIGTYDTPEEASDAYQRAHIEHFGSQSKFYKDEHHEPTE
jgi:hypothetical protein